MHGHIGLGVSRRRGIQLERPPGHLHLRLMRKTVNRPFERRFPIAHHGQTTSEKISTLMQGSTLLMRGVFPGTLRARLAPRAAGRRGPRDGHPETVRNRFVSDDDPSRRTLSGFRVPDPDRVEVGLREDRPEEHSASFRSTHSRTRRCSRSQFPKRLAPRSEVRGPDVP